MRRLMIVLLVGCVLPVGSAVAQLADPEGDADLPCVDLTSLDVRGDSTRLTVTARTSFRPYPPDVVIEGVRDPNSVRLCPGAVYRFAIDTDGDGLMDHALQTAFDRFGNAVTTGPAGTEATLDVPGGWIRWTVDNAALGIAGSAERILVQARTWIDAAEDAVRPLTEYDTRDEAPGQWQTFLLGSAASALVDAGGAEIPVTDPASPIVGTLLTVPAGAVDRPVAIALDGLKDELGAEVYFEPRGLRFAVDAVLWVPFDSSGFGDNDQLVVGLASSENEPADVGSEISLFYSPAVSAFDASGIEVRLPHFSGLVMGRAQRVYAVMDIDPAYLGTGDLLYWLSVKDVDVVTWFPGHTAILLRAGENAPPATGCDGQDAGVGTYVESFPHQGYFWTCIPEPTSYGVRTFPWRKPWRGVDFYLGARRPLEGYTADAAAAAAAWARERCGMGYFPVGDRILDAFLADRCLSCVELTESAYNSTGVAMLSSASLWTPLRQFNRTAPVDAITISAGKPFSMRVRGVVDLDNRPYHERYTEDIGSSEVSWTCLPEGTACPPPGATFDPLTGDIDWGDPAPGLYEWLFVVTGHPPDSPPVAVAQSLSVRVLPGEGDRDGDGVPDEEDACPGTSPGDAVDAVGCRLCDLSGSHYGALVQRRCFTGREIGTWYWAWELTQQGDVVEGVATWPRGVWPCSSSACQATPRACEISGTMDRCDAAAVELSLTIDCGVDDRGAPFWWDGIWGTHRYHLRYDSRGNTGGTLRGHVGVEGCYRAGVSRVSPAD